MLWVIIGSLSHADIYNRFWEKWESNNQQIFKIREIIDDPPPPSKLRAESALEYRKMTLAKIFSACSIVRNGLENGCIAYAKIIKCWQRMLWVIIIGSLSHADI